MSRAAGLGQREGGAGLGVARSALDPRASQTRLTTTLGWLAERTATHPMTVTRADLDDLDGWRTEAGTGTICHRSGRFFAVEGVEVTVEGAPVQRWQQPMIRQPEIGILGILTRTRDGVTEFLLQAKIEPGNPRGHQLSPTVQATRSNYTGVHRGKAVPYLEHFLEPAPREVVADVRQSEQGSWFLQKRNRNMIVEVAEPVELLDGFRWFTLAEIHHLLAVDNVVNMDSRTVLSCLPLGPQAVPPDTHFTAALNASLAGLPGRHTTTEVLSAVTDARTRAVVGTRPVPLDGLEDWYRTARAISHRTGAFFHVVGVGVQAEGREVAAWSQPMFAAVGRGVAAFLVRVVDGVLHVLVQLKVEPGFVDVVELAPTVQYNPHTHRHLPPRCRPRFLDHVTDADPTAVRFGAVMSEEGGRFLDTETEYLVVETDDDAEPPGYLWVTVHQLHELLRHSHYLNVQARTLVTCLHSLATPAPRRTS